MLSVMEVMLHGQEALQAGHVFSLLPPIKNASPNDVSGRIF